MDPILGHLMIGCDIDLGVLRNRHHPIHTLGDLGLHSSERVPASLANLFGERAGMFDLKAAVHGDWMVDRCQNWQKALNAEQPPTERLVVVNEVELVGAVAKVVPRPPGEGHRFGKVAEVERGVLKPIPAILQLEHSRLAHRKVLVEGLQTRELRQGHAIVEDGVRRSTEDLDGVAHVDESLGEMARIDTLAAYVRLASVGEIGDSQRRVAMGCDLRSHGSVSLTAGNRDSTNVTAHARTRSTMH